MDYQTIHPLKVFDLARSQGRFVYASAPMVRYSKLAFRQTVYAYGVDLTWTPMILAKEFNRSHLARDSDLTLSTTTAGDGTTDQRQLGQPPTIVQFGANSALEFARAASLAAPFVSGVDLNCGCPQSWACAEALGAALMERRERVRDMVVEARERLRRDGWVVGGGEADVESPRGRSVSVKIRVHKDLRKTIDFIDTVLGSDDPSSPARNIDFLTIHPRTRHTPSREPISVEALELLTARYGARVPILVSGDVFTLGALPYTSPLLPSSSPSGGSGNARISTTVRPREGQQPPDDTSTQHPTLPNLPKLAGLMSARALLANPALFAGHERCPWEAVEAFLNNAARAPLHLKLVLHHLSEMCGPGLGPDKRALLGKKERVELLACTNMCDVIDFIDEKIRVARGRGQGDEDGGIVRGYYGPVPARARYTRDGGSLNGT